MDMTEKERSEAARKFSAKWSNQGGENSDSQIFWLSLFRDVFGINKPEEMIKFQLPVKLKKSTGHIDALILHTKVLIEHKSFGVDLDKPSKQSDGIFLTPFQQALRYTKALPYPQQPRWIITCNFKELRIYDMLSYELYDKWLPYLMENQHKFKLSDDVKQLINRKPIIISVERLVQEYERLNFLVDPTDDSIKFEAIISTQAGEVIGEIRKAIENGYKISKIADYRQDLNKFCVQLLFCLYAEDANVFQKNQFHDYIKSKDIGERLEAISKLFKVLNQPTKERDTHIDDSLKNFPYVNGGLFEDDKIKLPSYTDDIDFRLISTAMNQFNWRIINPTIFGAMFESILDDDVRRAGGMHYTSVANIHKVIDPLFLDDLKIEFDSIKRTRKDRLKKLQDFQDRLASLKFFDPACGSGNFLTETYLSLRQLENEIIRELNKGNVKLLENPIKVSINQFYGIEINDFAVAVARTAMWIAENQMLQETAMIIHQDLKFLPLKNYATIKQANALRMDWAKFAPDVNYIIGNPPFVGFTYQTERQKSDMQNIFPNVKNLDYVCAWYKKASDLIKNTKIECGFVSTNSITQGETVARLFPFLDININFAYRTFKWTNEGNNPAAVHCVIIGFANFNWTKKFICEDKSKTKAKNINPYLLDAPNILVTSRNKPLCDVPAMIYGNKPADGGNLIIEAEEYDDFIKREPNAKKFIRPLLGATEYLNNKKRYCLWLVGGNPSELKKLPLVMRRIEKCKQMRQNSIAKAIQKFAETPTLFAQITQPEGVDFIIVPRVSSERRKYIPIGFVNKEVIASDAVQIIPNANLYHFGMLTSSVHMAWTRTVCGRLKSDYRYSKDIVYNNFVWPKANETNRLKIEETAAEILNVRKEYPERSLASLYDEYDMPKKRREAHQANDRAVMNAYGFNESMTEAEIVAALMKMYQKIIVGSSKQR